MIISIGSSLLLRSLDLWQMRKVFAPVQERYLSRYQAVIFKERNL
jgi:hypothetical protein